MGVYVFRSRHIPAVKIGSHGGKNAWGRLRGNGFKSLLKPAELENRVNICDLELLYWFPQMDNMEEFAIHTKFEKYRIIGEWFTAEVVDLISELVFVPNMAASCIIPSEYKKRKVHRKQQIASGLKEVTLTDDGIQEVIHHEEDSSPEDILPTYIESKPTKKLLSNMMIDQIIQLLLNKCELCDNIVSYSLKLIDTKKACLKCFEEHASIRHSEVEQYLLDNHMTSCTLCGVLRTDRGYFENESVNIHSRSKVLTKYWYYGLPLAEVKETIDGGQMMCCVCFNIVIEFERKYGYRRRGSREPFANSALHKDADLYMECMSGVFERLRRLPYGEVVRGDMGADCSGVLPSQTCGLTTETYGDL